MKHRHFPSAPKALAAALLATVLGGCAAPSGQPGDAAASAPSSASDSGAAQSSGAAPSTIPAKELQARRELGSAIARYEAGHYAEAIRLLQASPAIWAASAETRVEALKILAFSQCVSQRAKACRESFDALLQLAPAFNLTPSEAGHPMWGKAFLAAKVAAIRRQAAR